jgi:hypothetical protein
VTHSATVANVTSVGIQLGRRVAAGRDSVLTAVALLHWPRNTCRQ